MAVVDSVQEPSVTRVMVHVDFDLVVNHLALSLLVVVVVYRFGRVVLVLVADWLLVVLVAGSVVMQVVGLLVQAVVFDQYLQIF